MILLDTTVLVYAVGDDHALREPAQELIRGAGAGALRCTTTVEAIQEFAHVRTRRRDRKDAAALAGAYATLLGPLLEPGEDDLRAGLELWTRHEQLGCFDAVLAAAAVSAGATALISADRTFAAIRTLPFVPLEAGAVARLLA
jgi:hypothetical protein